jgi:lysophospholipase L1-like esterase
MKKRFTLILFFFLVNSVLFWAGAARGNTLYLPFITKDCSDPVILAVGDSITYGTFTSSNGPATAYPRFLELKLEQNYPRNFTVINQGIGGDRSVEVWNRIAGLLDAYHPDLVLLMIGTNDFLSGAEDAIVFNNLEWYLRHTIEIIQGRGVKMILATNPPVDWNRRPGQSNRVANFHSYYFAYASFYQIPLADVFSSFMAVPNWVDVLMYPDPDDGVHPIDAGQQVIRDAFYNQLVPLLDRRGCFR